MITLPPAVLRAGQQVGKWFVKNGPTMMSVGGGVMAVAGAVMACQATLHADDILEVHCENMRRIAEAKALSDKSIEDGTFETADQVYTETQMKQDKVKVYAQTAGAFVKLYAPAVTVGLGGIGLMQGAFAISEKRRATAVSALSAMSEAYSSLLTRAEDQGINVIPEEKWPVKEEGQKKPKEKAVVNLDDVDDPFFFIFDESNPNWAGDTGFLLNERFLTAQIDAMNFKLSAGTVDHFWVNDLLKAWDFEETDIGHFYGWNGRAGDIIEYEILPYRIVREDTNVPDEPPLLLPTDMDTLREMEMSDLQDGYCIGIRLLVSASENGSLIPPRMIYNEVYGK